MKMLAGALLAAFTLPTLAQQSLPSGTYTYDGAGNITAIGQNIYSYDAVGRLTKAEVFSNGVKHTQEYEYDAYGNITKLTKEGVITSIGVDANTNRLTDVVQNAYDEAGNLRIDGSFTYTYDSLGQMAEKVAPQVHEYYVYDANDERIAVRSAPDNWQFTFRDLNGKPLRSFRGSELSNWSQAWTWVQDWVWREGQLLGSEHPPTDGGRQHYHLDHLGTPRLATTVNGLAVAQHDYYPYGVEITHLRQEVAVGFSQEQAMKFTGHERDFTGGTTVENTNYLDYMHARSYSPNWSRFLSVDRVLRPDKSATTPQLWNRYTYARGNPLRLIDPDGLAEKDSIIRLTVRVYYDRDTVDSPRQFGNATLRAVTEAAIPRARSFYAHAGIVLDFKRADVTMNTWSGSHNYAIVSPVTGSQRFQDVAKQQSGLTMFVSNAFVFAGKTPATGGPSLIGSSSDNRAVYDEIGHALGNNPSVKDPIGLTNVVADSRLDFQEFLVNHGQTLSPWFEDTFRENAEKIAGPRPAGQ